MRERKDKIKNFLSRFFRNHELRDDDDIFAMGFVNSLLALQLVNFLQKEFSITVEDEDLDFENFRTINNMDALLERKLAAPVETGRAPAITIRPRSARKTTSGSSTSTSASKSPFRAAARNASTTSR